MTEEEKIVMGSRAEETVTCANCGKEIKVGESHAYAGENDEDIYFCNNCQKEIDNALEEETKNPNVIGATLLGVLAGIVGGIIWYWITVLTNYSIGYIALFLGWLIGSGVCLGAGREKGFGLQILSAAIMLVTLLVSELIIYIHYGAVNYEINMTTTELLLKFISSGQFGDLIKAFLKDSVSPIGLVIWGIGLYVSFIIPKPRKL